MTKHRHKFTLDVTTWNTGTGESTLRNITVEIDIPALARYLAKRASRNKSGRSSIQSGIIKGKINDA